VARAISTLRSEPAWDELEALGPVLILGAQFPYLVIGATKKWSQLTGFLMSDVVAKDISFLEGAQSNKVLFRHVCAEVCRGHASHACLTHYRRDGSAFVNSVHGFPVFDGNQCIGADIDISAQLLEEESMTTETTEPMTMHSNGGVSVTIAMQEEGERDESNRSSGFGDIENNNNTTPVTRASEYSAGDSYSSAVSSGVHLESVSRDACSPGEETHSPMNGKGSQHKSANSLGDKSESGTTNSIGRKSPLNALGYGSFAGETTGKTAFIVLQFSCIADSRSVGNS
jgi:hypothetical protein